MLTSICRDAWKKTSISPPPISPVSLTLPVSKSCAWNEYMCLCVFVCDDPPCPSCSVVRWWACQLLCQWSCPTGTHRWGGAPTLASHPPWLNRSQHEHNNWVRQRHIKQKRGNMNKGKHLLCVFLKYKCKVQYIVLHVYWQIQTNRICFRAGLPVCSFKLGDLF